MDFVYTDLNEYNLLQMLTKEDQAKLTQERAARYLKRSAMLTGIYFVSRFGAAIISNTIFTLLFGPSLINLPNILLPIIAWAFWQGLEYTLKLPSMQNHPSRTAFLVGRYGAIGWLITASLFALVSVLVPDLLDGTASLAIFELIYWGTAAVAFVGLGMMIHLLYRQKVIAGTTFGYLLLGLVAITANWLTLYPFTFYYILVSTFFLLMGCGWYLGVLQLAALIETGKDQPVTSWQFIDR
jgi:hypothetical protein